MSSRRMLRDYATHPTQRFGVLRAMGTGWRPRTGPSASSRLAMKLDRWSGVGFQAELSWTEIRFTSMTYLLRRPRPNFPKAGPSLRRPVSGQFWLHRYFVKELQSEQFMYADRKSVTFLRSRLPFSKLSPIRP